MFSIFFGFPSASLNNVPVSTGNNGYKVVFGIIIITTILKIITNYYFIGLYHDAGGIVGAQKGLHLYDINGVVVATTSLPSFDGTYKEVIISYNKGKWFHNIITVISIVINITRY